MRRIAAFESCAYNVRRDGFTKATGLTKRSDPICTLLGIKGSPAKFPWIPRMPVEAVEIDEKEPVDLSAAKDNAWDDDDYSDSYDFDTFIAKMRHPSCKPILENVKR